MNIQPICVNQNRQPNFGINVKWSVTQYDLEQSPIIEARNITAMKQHIRNFIEKMPDKQKAQLGELMKALKNVAGELEFNKLVPDDETFIGVFVHDEKGKRKDGINIHPRLLDTASRIEHFSQEFIRAIKSLLPKNVNIETKKPVKLEELLPEFGITA